MTTAINRDLLKTLRPEIEAALAAIAAQHGVKFKVGNATFDPTLGTFKFNLEGRATGGDAPELIHLRRYAAMYNIDLAWLDRDKMVAGKAYRMTGLKLGSRLGAKITATGPDGRTYLFKPASFAIAAAPVAPRAAATASAYASGEL